MSLKYNPNVVPIRNEEMRKNISDILAKEEARLMAVIARCLSPEKVSGGISLLPGALPDYAEASNEIGRIRTMIRLFQ